MRHILARIILGCIGLCLMTSCHMSYKSKAKMYRRQAQNCHCKGYTYFKIPSEKQIPWKDAYEQTELSAVYPTIR